MTLPENNKEHGQSLVEFALTLPILILILSGLLDFGRAYYTFIALEEAVAEAALYLAISPDCPDEITDATDDLYVKCQDPNNALWRAENSGSDEFDISLATWNIPFTAAKDASGFEQPFVDNGCQVIGCTALVQVRYQFEILMPGIEGLVSSVTGNDGFLELRTQASQIIVFEQE